MNQAERDRRLVSVMPSPRQIALENMEFYAFFHFGMNTYTDREWGTGTESPSLFCHGNLLVEEASYEQLCFLCGFTHDGK